MRRLLSLLLRYAAAGFPVGERALRSALALAWHCREAPNRALPDPALIETAASALREMLEEIEDLSRRLPPDAQAIGLAAKSLAERSLDECQQARVNTVRLVADMQQIGQLALAMRERLLLFPWERKSLPN